MKIFITFFLFSFSTTMFSQAPIIEGDPFLCFNTDKTATVSNNIIYDTYQWYSKYSFEEDSTYEPIIGATSSSFVYNVLMESLTIKLVTTLNDVSYESNTIELMQEFDNGIFVDNTFNGEGWFDFDQGFVICLESSITFTNLSLPYSENLQWFKNDILLEDEVSDSITITEPGIYHARSSRVTCPLDYTYFGPYSIIKIDCETADTKNNKFENSIKLYPNPTQDLVYFENELFKINKYEIYSIEGKKLVSKKIENETNSISLENLSSGTYLIKLFNGSESTLRKVVKK